MPTLSEAQIATALDDLPGWRLDGEAITKTFDRGDFAGSVGFVNAITPAAEAANHHPDVEISWKNVTITLSTHSEGGLTAADFAMAREIDLLA